MKVKLLLIIVLLAGICSIAAAGIESVSTDTQGEILYKLSTSTDGAVLTLQQGPTEAGSAVKLRIKNVAGNTVASISADGTVTITGQVVIQ